MTSTIYETAKRKAVKGHKDWIVWIDRSGEQQAALCTADALKSALLASGTAGRFIRIGASGLGSVVRWHSGLTMLRNCRKGFDGPDCRS